MQATNRIILGTAQFGLTYGINNKNGKPNQSKVDEILSFAFESGIRCLDTAEIYGNAHEVIGSYHKRNPSKNFNVITKLPHDFFGEVNEKIDFYLEQLNITKINALLFHSFETYKKNEKLVKKLKSSKKDGKVENVGVSIYTNQQFEEVLNDIEIDIIQLPFNLFDNNNHRGNLIKLAKAKGKIIHTRSAFLQGLFFLTLQNEHTIAQKLSNELKTINNISQHSNISIAKIALNYCLQQEYIDNILIGIDTIEQLKQNIFDADCSLSDFIIKEIESIKIENVNLLNPSLWNS
jgi:aryl-alcohol dehydrogenase-like predicted oxidoreductase